MSVDDLLFAPILPDAVEQMLQDLVKKIMSTEPNDKLATTVANQIIKVFAENGISDDQEIIDNVHRIIKELNGHMWSRAEDVVPMELLHQLKRREIDDMMDAIFGPVP